MAAQAVEQYQDSLSVLDLSKIQITSLTMLAEDHKEFAVQIVACIESHLKSVPNGKKLSVLYLIDSICKNFPDSSYVNLFTQNIVSNFCHVFEVSNEKTRSLLYKLRLTWQKTKTFPARKLNAIDERVHKMDPKWPVLAKEKAAASEPVVKNSLSDTQNQQSQQQTSREQEIQPTRNGTSNKGRTGAQQQKRSQNDQPSNARGKRLRSSAQQVPTNVAPFQQMPTPHLPFQQLTPAIQPFQQPPSPNAYSTIAPYGFTATPDGYYSEIAPILLAQPQVQPPLAQSLQPTPPVTQQVLTHQAQPQQQLPTKTTPSSNDIDSLTLESLYGGKQCSNCSLRFDDSNKYAIHLDWHYRQNLKSDTKFARRKWYYPLNLWVQFREINDDDVQENITSDNNNVNDLLISTQNDHEVFTAPASREDEKNICSVCHETFEKFWAEEEEEWRLRNARLHDDERVYHPLCLMDMLQASVAK